MGWGEFGEEGGECSFILCDLMGKKETIFPSHVSSSQWSTHLVGAGGVREITVLQPKWDGERSTVCHTVNLSGKAELQLQLLNFYRQKRNVTINSDCDFPITLLRHLDRLLSSTREKTMLTSASKCFSFCYPHKDKENVYVACWQTGNGHCFLH